MRTLTKLNVHTLKCLKVGTLQRLKVRILRCLKVRTLRYLKVGNLMSLKMRALCFNKRNSRVLRDENNCRFIRKTGAIVNSRISCNLKREESLNYRRHFYVILQSIC